MGREATDESRLGMGERASENIRVTRKIRERGDYNIGLIDFTE